MGLWAFLPPLLLAATLVRQIVDWSRISRREGLLALEPTSNDYRFAGEKRPATVVDAAIRKSCAKRSKWRWFAFEDLQRQAPDLGSTAVTRPPYASWAGAGLITSWKTSQPARLGGGIAVAFVATVYGVASQSWSSCRLQTSSRPSVAQQAVMSEILVERLVAIATEKPRIIETRCKVILSSAPLKAKMRRKKYLDQSNPTTMNAGWFPMRISSLCCSIFCRDVRDFPR